MKVALTIIGVVLGLIALAVLAIITIPFKESEGAVITALISLKVALRNKLLPSGDAKVDDEAEAEVVVPDVA